METLLYILAATTLISLASLVGVFFLYAKRDSVQKILPYLLALAAGTMLGGAFLHLIPEAAEELTPLIANEVVLAAFFAYYVLEKILHLYHSEKHHHTAGEKDCHYDARVVGYLNLINDGIHNFVDGFIIAIAFMLSVPVGLMVTFGVLLHEIPQELGDFGVLLYAGFTRRKAMFWNFVIALSAVLGGLVGYLLVDKFEAWVPYLLAIGAGGFLYIATSELLPQIRKEQEIGKVIKLSLTMIVGILLMGGLLFLG